MDTLRGQYVRFATRATTILLRFVALTILTNQLTIQEYTEFVIVVGLITLFSFAIGFDSYTFVHRKISDGILNINILISQGLVNLAVVVLLLTLVYQKVIPSPIGVTLFIIIVFLEYICIELERVLILMGEIEWPLLGQFIRGPLWMMIFIIFDLIEPRQYSNMYHLWIISLLICTPIYMFKLRSYLVLDKVSVSAREITSNLKSIVLYGALSLIGSISFKYIFYYDKTLLQDLSNGYFFHFYSLALSFLFGVYSVTEATFLIQKIKNLYSSSTTNKKGTHNLFREICAPMTLRYLAFSLLLSPFFLIFLHMFAHENIRLEFYQLPVFLILGTLICFSNVLQIINYSRLMIKINTFSNITLLTVFYLTLGLNQESDIWVLYSLILAFFMKTVLLYINYWVNRNAY